MDTQVIKKNAKNGNAKETFKKGAALAGAAGLGAGAVVSADIVRGDEELAIVEPISPMDEEVIGQNAEDAVTIWHRMSMIMFRIATWITQWTMSLTLDKKLFW